jgi:hypothetical protein
VSLSFVGSKSGSHTATTAQSVSLTDLLNSAGAAATLQQNDIVVVAVAHSMATTASRTMAQLTPTGYSVPSGLAVVQASDTNAVSLGVTYKFMPATPDTTISIPACAAAGNSISYSIQVWRGADTFTPFSGFPTTASSANSGLPNPPSITTTAGLSGLVVIGATAAAVASATAITNTGATPYDSTANLFTAGLQNTATNRSVVAMGAKTGLAASTAFDAAVGGSDTTNTGSWAAVSLLLAPTTLRVLTWHRNTSNNLNFGYVSEQAPTGAKVGIVGSLSNNTGSKSAGSTLSIAATGNTGGGRFAIDGTTGQVTVVAGATFNFSTEPTILLDVVETLAGAANTPKTTTLTVRVKPIFGSAAVTVAWDTNDRVASSIPTTVTGTSVTGANGVNSIEGIRANRGYKAGAAKKIYIEATVGAVIAGTGLTWGLAAASASIKEFSWRPGLSDTTGFAWNSAGGATANGANLNGGSPITGATFVATDILMLAIDVATGKIWIGKNGTWLASGNPASGTSPVATIAAPQDYFLWCGPANNDQLTANWGDTATTYAAPSGFTAYNAGIPSGRLPSTHAYMIFT